VGILDIEELTSVANPAPEVNVQQVADAAELFAARYTGRLLQPDPAFVDGTPPADTADPVTKRIVIRGHRRQSPWIRIPDAREITAVTLDGTALTADVDYELSPPDAPTATHLELIGPRRRAYYYEDWEPRRIVEVTGRFGFSTVPPDLYRAIMELAARRIYEQAAGFVDAVQSAEWGTRQYVKQMPTSVRAVFDSYVIPSDRLTLA
jgi:hypothetical protein